MFQRRRLDKLQWYLLSKTFLTTALKLLTQTSKVLKGFILKLLLCLILQLYVY